MRFLIITKLLFSNKYLNKILKRLFFFFFLNMFTLYIWKLGTTISEKSFWNALFISSYLNRLGRNSEFWISWQKEVLMLRIIYYLKLGSSNVEYNSDFKKTTFMIKLNNLNVYRLCLNLGKRYLNIVYPNLDNRV